MSEQTAAKLRAARTEIRGLRHALEIAERERDAAREMADPFVCDLLGNESSDEGDGWRDIGTDPDGLHGERHYAEERGLIEQSPTKRNAFRFTADGRKWR